MLSAEQIEAKVDRLLKEHGVEEPPIPVDSLARRLGAVIRREPYDGELSGALYRQGGLCVIGLNRKEPPVRQRFTIAHELGHLILHDEAVYIDRSFPSELSLQAAERTGKKRFRSKESDKKNQEEIEANRFAATILMPRKFLLEDLSRLKIPVPIRSLADLKPLATIYRVSIEALAFRLINLGIAVESS